MQFVGTGAKKRPMVWYASASDLRPKRTDGMISIAISTGPLFRCGEGFGSVIAAAESRYLINLAGDLASKSMPSREAVERT